MDLHPGGVGVRPHGADVRVEHGGFFDVFKGRSFGFAEALLRHQGALRGPPPGAYLQGPGIHRHGVGGNEYPPQVLRRQDTAHLPLL